MGSDGECGIEENEEVWFGADRGVIGVGIKFFDDRGGGGEVATGGAATGGDFIGVDAEFIGVAADPADGGFGVGDTVFDFDVVPRGDAIFGGDGDHAAIGEVFALFLELFRGAAFPAAAEEEDDGGGVGIGRVIGGVVDVEGEFGAVDGLVGFLFRGALGCFGGSGGFFLGLGEVEAVGEGEEGDEGEDEAEVFHFSVLLLGGFRGLFVLGILLLLIRAGAAVCGDGFVGEDFFDLFFGGEDFGVF